MGSSAQTARMVSAIDGALGICWVLDYTARQRRRVRQRNRPNGVALAGKASQSGSDPEPFAPEAVPSAGSNRQIPAPPHPTRGLIPADPDQQDAGGPA